MTIQSGWCQRAPRTFADGILAGVNLARSKATILERRDGLTQVLRTLGSTASQMIAQQELQAITELLKKIETNSADASDSAVKLDEYFDVLFERPSQRLAVYGTLKPGGSNAGQMAGIEGVWMDGEVRGVIKQPGEYLEYTWITDGPRVAVKVFSAPRLSEHFTRLDEFEGPDYQRSLVPVVIEGVLQVCNIYEGRYER